MSCAALSLIFLAVYVAANNQCTDVVASFDPTYDYMRPWRTKDFVFSYSQYIQNVSISLNYVTLNLFEPMPVARWREMAFVRCGTPAPLLPNGTTIIYVPVATIAASETPQVAGIELLGQLGKMRGFEEPSYLEDDLQYLVQAGQIQGFSCSAAFYQSACTGVGCMWYTDWGGYCSGANNTRLREINPSIIFSGALQGGRFDASGVPSVPVPGSLEPDILGLTEYVKLFALVTMIDPSVATSWFSAVKGEYENVRGIAQSAPRRPLVWVGYSYADTWYQAKAHSYTAQLLEDAGADYIFQSDQLQLLSADLQAAAESGSCPSTNAALNAMFAPYADFWYNTGLPGPQSTPADLQQLYPALNITSWRAMRCGSTFGNNKLTAYNYGPNPFFSEGPAKPNIVLKDLVKILHPGISLAHDPVFMRVISRDATQPWPDDCPSQVPLAPAVPEPGTVSVSATLMIEGLFQHEYAEHYTEFRMRVARAINARSVTDVTASVVRDGDADMIPAVRVDLCVLTVPAGRTAYHIVSDAEHWLDSAMLLPGARRAVFVVDPYITGTVPTASFGPGAIAGVVVGGTAFIAVVAGIAAYMAYWLGWKHGYARLDDKQSNTSTHAAPGASANGPALDGEPVTVENRGTA